MPPSPWKNRSCRVLAQRNPSVAPVGAWVESAPAGPEQSLAFAAAFQVEEELKEQQQQKAARLRRFQGEVKQRVNQQVRMRRKLQLQRSCEAAERESSVAVQYSGSTLPWTRMNTCLFRSHPTSTIGIPSAPRAIPVPWQGEQDEPFQQHAAELSKTMKRVRHRLAACKTVPQGAGPLELPGGVWRQEKPDSCEVPAGDEGEELLLAGQHDVPAELQGQETAPPQAEQDDDFYIKIEFNKFIMKFGRMRRCESVFGLHQKPPPGISSEFCDAPVKEPSSPEPPQGVHTHHRVPLILWPGVDQEETKKQRQDEYLRYRRLFMSIEREQVKEQQRQKERQKRIARIKSKQENQRRAAEQRMQEVAEQQEPSSGEAASASLAQLELEERRVRKVKEKQQRDKESVRYMEALRAQMREKIKLSNIDLPPLCSCGADFWDSHPDTCANNCVFYRNHQAYSRALRSLISSCDPLDGSPSTTLLLRGLATLCTRSRRRL
ncbi:coiled-coil domain-containing protein 15 isoform X2 [Strigops habroptila]|uniref:Coiled-coil domain containing 15 n=1 Tax=Strigops habroptila TaxID=2489341 RepID=A0A672VA90_STRHB|nr:coiled-coil domain-containing protein 15 isoform X2 [Strigops habroptila]